MSTLHDPGPASLCQQGAPAQPPLFARGICLIFAGVGFERYGIEGRWLHQSIVIN